MFTSIISAIITVIILVIVAVYYPDMAIFSFINNNLTTFQTIGSLAIAGSAIVAYNAYRQNNKREKDKLYAQRLYFISTMKGISTSSEQYAQLLENHLNHFIKLGKTDIDLSGDIEFHLLEMDEAYKDYIIILHNEKIPATLKYMKKDFILAIKNLVDLKNDIYSIKPRLKALSHKKTIDEHFLRFIVNKLKTIAINAELLQKSNSKPHSS